MRYSASGEQNLKTSLILQFVHQLLFTNRHRPPPLDSLMQLLYLADGPKTQLAVCYPCCCSATTWWNIRYYSFKCPDGRIVLIGAHPFYYPMIAHWLIGLMVEADYVHTVRSLQGTPTYIPYISVSSSCEWRGFGPCRVSEVNPLRLCPVRGE